MPAPHRSSAPALLLAAALVAGCPPILLGAQAPAAQERTQGGSPTASAPASAGAGAQDHAGLDATSTPAQLRMALAAEGERCLAAARELGRRGNGALSSLGQLASAARTGCGLGAPEPRTALILVASAVAAGAADLSREELAAVLAAFEEAEGALGGPLPAEVEGSLATMRGTLRGQNLGWISGILTALGAVIREAASALGAVGGILVALLVVAGVLLGFRHAGRFLPRLRSGRQGATTEEDQVELWLRRPGGKPGTPMGSGAGSRDADGEPGDAAASSPSRRPEEGVGNRVDVILGSIRNRHVPGPESPPWETVERVIQAVAWETMRGGGFTEWVSLDQLTSLGPPEEIETVLAYAGVTLGTLTLDARRGRVRVSTPPPVTARLGSLHLLRESRGSSAEILSQLGDLHAAAGDGGGDAGAEGFLSTVAAAVLEVAEGEGCSEPDLGVAEEALRELAAPPRPLALVGDRSPGEPGAPGVMRAADGPSPGDDVRVRRLLARLRAEKHPGVREKLVTAIGRVGPGALPALPALRGVMESDSVGVALAAVEAVGRIGPSAGAMAPLLMGYLEGGHHGLRVAAARSLGRLGPAGAPAAPLLMEWVSQGGVPHELRARAAEALGSMPGEAAAAIPPLAELLRSPVAVDVRAAAALALARLDSGRPDVAEALARAHETPDPALRGMVGIALLVRERRLTERGRRSRGTGGASRWALPLTACAGSLAVVEGAAVTLTQLATPGALLPALLVTPALAFPAGVAYGVATRRLRTHPALGGGAAGWAGASAGLMGALLLTSALTPVAVAAAGGLALGSGAMGGALVRTALRLW